MIIRTKIVATLGPASSDAAVIEKLVLAGCDVFRLNFSHGAYKDHQRLLEAVRQVERKLNTPVAIMGDLCGPKIRVGNIPGGPIVLEEGGSIIIQRAPIDGTAARISITLAELVDQVKPGETLLLDDGKIKFEIISVDAPVSFTCRIVRGGLLSSGKGVNLPNTQLRLSALTAKDRADAAWIAPRDFDYVALSFVRSAADVVELRELLESSGSGAQIVSKIEKPQALERIEEIIQASDAVMVARGDMGVEMDLVAVPVAQKRIAKLAHQAGKPCIVATQMLESMINSATPTRAEVSDVANAVLDAADAVMLSGETAVGKFPVEAVSMMNRTVEAIESYHDEQMMRNEAPLHRSMEAAMASAVREIIAHEEIAAVAVFTATGSTARMFSKARLPRPIVAMSPDAAVVRRMCLYYGVAAVRQTDPPEHTREVLELAARMTLEQRIAQPGDKIIVISGRPIGKPGHTNTLVVHTV